MNNYYLENSKTEYNYHSVDDLIDVRDIQPEDILDDIELMRELGLYEEYALHEELGIEGGSSDE